MICGQISTDDQNLYKCVLVVGNEDPSLINPVFASRVSRVLVDRRGQTGLDFRRIALCNALFDASRYSGKFKRVVVTCIIS